VSDSKRPVETPPELPPEYAEAYRRGYERAYREAAAGSSALPTQRGPDDTEETLVDVPTAPAHAAEPAVEDPEHPEEPAEDNLFDRLFGPADTSIDTSADTPPAEDPKPSHRAQPRDDHDRPRWLVPVLLVGLVAVLLLGAYGVGRMFSTSVGDTDVSPGEPDGVQAGDTGSDSGDSSGDQAQDGEQAPRPDHYQGAVRSAEITGASASCQSPSSVDAGGNPVSYPPANLHDGNMATAWRCNGDGIGETVTIALPGETPVGEVGLVPGYAKIDPRNGVDRYAENNRITKVRWTFTGGSSFVQTLDGSPDNRSMQTLRIPVTVAEQVEIEILDSVGGPRNTVAISEVRVGRAIR
jgi:hypothetical protein